MDINMTLLVQMGNFLIAYGMIRALLIKPVYAVLMHEAAEQADLQETVESRSIILAQKEREKQEQWQAHQVELVGAMPAPKSESLFVTRQGIPSPEIITLSAQEIEQLTHEIARVMIKNVEGDHAQ